MKFGTPKSTSLTLTNLSRDSLVLLSESTSPLQTAALYFSISVNFSFLRDSEAGKVNIFEHFSSDLLSNSEISSLFQLM
jgi:hypothetical protein